MHYFPLALPFFIALFLFFAAVVVLVEQRIIQYAFEKAGVPRRSMFALLLLASMGSSEHPPYRPAGGRKPGAG